MPKAISTKLRPLSASKKLFFLVAFKIFAILAFDFFYYLLSFIIRKLGFFIFNIFSMYNFLSFYGYASNILSILLFVWRVLRLLTGALTKACVFYKVCFFNCDISLSIYEIIYFYIRESFFLLFLQSFFSTSDNP